VARLVAALHDTPAPLVRRVGTAELLGHPRACAALLATVEPAWTRQLDALLGELAAGEADVAGLPTATLHGDLHPRNILVDGEQLVLIDLDGARAGAAVLELGAWIADTLSRALFAGEPLGAAQVSAAQFVHAYRADSGQPAGDAALAWATARALLCDRAYRSVANLKHGRYPRVAALLALARFIARHGVVERPLPAL
jgi:Ser/Thr protein kinase RdoA (MazF antagonist)